jgi:bile acid-coenzyme A ligase
MGVAHRKSPQTRVQKDKRGGNGLTATRAATASRPPTNLIPMGQLLTYQAGRDPDHPAYSFGGRTWSRGELERAANRYARALQAEGVVDGDLVTLAMPNGADFHIAAFACWKLGATPAPVSHRLPDMELQAIVALAAPRLVIGADAARLPGHTVLPHDHAPDSTLSDAPHEPRISLHWKAMTSGGSTGRPKLIVDQRPSFFDPEVTALGILPDDVILNPAPGYHNAPFCFTNWAIAWGGHVVEMQRFDAAETLDLIARYGVRWVYLVPTMMHRILNLGAAALAHANLSSLELVLHMAAPCPAWLKERMIDWLGPDRIMEIYAGTESVGSCAITGADWLAHRGSVGRPVAGAEVEILGESHEILPQGEIGEIFFRPPAGRPPNHVLRGAESRTIGTLESYGDMGWLDADGYLYIADRRTDMIVSGGANLYPAEIEAALEAHDAVACCVAIGLPDEDMGQIVHAIVQLRDDIAPPARDTLDAFLSLRLAPNKLPRSYEFTRTALRDDAGKVRRSALRQERMR